MTDSRHFGLRLLLTAVLAVTVQCVLAAYPKHLRAVTPDGRTVTVTALDDNILKITNTAPGEKARRGTASVLDESTDGELLNPGGKGMSANICGIQVSLTSAGVLTLNAGPGKSVVDSGIRPLDGSGRSVIELKVDGNGAFYGAGERGHRLNLRGDTLVNYNRPDYGYTGGDPRISQMGITMPLFLSTDGYAIVFDDFATSELILSEPIKYVTESPEPVSWYFVNGAKTLADVSESLSRLTGRQNLPPLWTLGYITSRYGYKSQAETEDVVDSLKHAGYPVDGVILDLYWYGKEQDMGRLAWDYEHWPDPDDMMAYLRKRGVNVVTIAQPFVLTEARGAANFKTLSEGGMLLRDSTGKATQPIEIWVGKGGMFDVSNPDTRRWLTDRYSALTDRGLAGWWGDLGEPEKHPDNSIHANGLTGRQYHNRYGNDWSSIIYDMYRDKYPDRRIMTMMRAGTTGLQRYGVFPWSGDVSRSWGGLEPQIRIMLNTGLSGPAYMGHDVGGFAVDENAGPNPELYVRWLQLGLFSPVLRTHAQKYAEPYYYPEQQDIILDLVKDRYRWLPYNYTLAWENSTKGYPLVRPLNFHSPLGTDKALETIDDEFLWGRDVLVAPVLKEGAVSRDITLPAGNEWIDFNNPSNYYKGGTVIRDYPAPLSVLPLFVREGAFIPMAEYNMGNTSMYNPSRLTLRYFPSHNFKTSYTLFEDDMKTPGENTGNTGRTITFSGDATPRGIDISMVAEGSYTGQSEAKAITLVISDQNRKPRSVTFNGRNVNAAFDKDAGTLTLSFLWKTAKPGVVQVRF